MRPQHPREGRRRCGPTLCRVSDAAPSVLTPACARPERCSFLPRVRAGGRRPKGSRRSPCRRAPSEGLSVRLPREDTRMGRKREWPWGVQRAADFARGTGGFRDLPPNAPDGAGPPSAPLKDASTIFPRCITDKTWGSPSRQPRRTPQHLLLLGLFSFSVSSVQIDRDPG